MEGALEAEDAGGGRNLRVYGIFIRGGMEPFLLQNWVVFFFFFNIFIGV